MSCDVFWRTRDPRGLVHHVHVVAHPLLLGHNNVEYVDYPTTFCGDLAGDRVDVSVDGLVTCIVCFTAWVQLETAVRTYINERVTASVQT